MKHLLIIIWALILPIALAGQTKSQIVSDITNTLNDFASDLSFVNERPDFAIANIQSISQTFGSAEYFLYNKRQVSSFQKWIEEYCFQVLNKEYVGHTFKIIQQSVEKVDKKETGDKRFSFDAIMQRESSGTFNDKKKISFIIEWKGEGQYISILEIKGDFSGTPAPPGLMKTSGIKLISNNQQNTYEYVDLGLSVKWATRNLGASAPEVNGDKYGWGELTANKVVDKKKSRTYNKKEPQQIFGSAQYDAARAKLKGNWRMPTSDELRELQQKCKWETMTLDSIYVIKATGPNGNSIIFPRGQYWSGNSIDKKSACNIDIDKSITWYGTPTINIKPRIAMSSAGRFKYQTIYIRPVIE